MKRRAHDKKRSYYMLATLCVAADFRITEPSTTEKLCVIREEPDSQSSYNGE